MLLRIATLSVVELDQPVGKSRLWCCVTAANFIISFHAMTAFAFEHTKKDLETKPFG
jgi:hypothetical protein